MLRRLFQLVDDPSNDLTRDIEVVVLRHQLMVLAMVWLEVSVQSEGISRVLALEQGRA